VGSKVERSGIVRVLDRHSLHGEPLAWISERVELVEVATGTFDVVQHPSEAGGEQFVHVEGVSLDEAEYVYRALRPRRTR
jgi:hypothetical protein